MPSGSESRVSLRFAFRSRVSRCVSFARFSFAIRCVSLSCLEQELRFGCVSANVRESRVSTAFRCVSPDASSKNCVSGLRFNRAFRPPESHLKYQEPLGSRCAARFGRSMSIDSLKDQLKPDGLTLLFNLRRKPVFWMLAKLGCCHGTSCALVGSSAETAAE